MFYSKAEIDMVTSDFFTTLPEKGIIKLSGEERVKYLQGQVTADVVSLQPNKALLACHCDFKGKTWSVSYLIDWQDQLLLITHQSVIEKSLAELKKYGVFAKVDIVNDSENWLISAGTGHAVEAEILRIFGHLPETNQEICQSNNGIVMAIQDSPMRYLIIQPSNANAKLKLSESADGPALWEIEDIKAGIADIRSETSNEFVPQMMNLQHLDAISFTKGCYMGQEVVARTKYLGKNKRAAYRLFSEGVHTIASGDNLECQVGENWRPAGTILRNAATKNQTWLLAVLAFDTEIGANLRLKSNPSVFFTVLPQPYEVES